MYTGSLITPTEQKIQLVGMFGAKTPLLSHLMLKMHHFTKTGSGQTWERLIKRDAFCVSQHPSSLA
jgi:hypothetical protein